MVRAPLVLAHATVRAAGFDQELGNYKLVDTDGQAFSDAALSERADERQLGADNIWLGPHFVMRLAHLGWGFGPSITALGLRTSFDHDNSPVSVHKVYATAAEAFPRTKKTLFQKLNMPDNQWNKKGLNIPPKRAFEIFVPNVCAIDMDTTGTWPYGRRLEDQVATRFLALFLDMDAEIGASGTTSKHSTTSPCGTTRRSNRRRRPTRSGTTNPFLIISLIWRSHGRAKAVLRGHRTAVDGSTPE